jgi:hypothetical protein
VTLPSTPRDSLEIPLGPVMRFKAKRMKKEINGLLQDTWVKVNFKNISKNKE